LDQQVDEEANIELDMLIGFLPEHIQSVAGEVMTACAKQQGTDVCNRMYNIAKCVQEKRPEVSIHGFIIPVGPR
jgi:hypothetical protein